MKAAQKWGRIVDDLITHGTDEGGNIATFQFTAETSVSMRSSLEALFEAVQMSKGYMKLHDSE